MFRALPCSSSGGLRRNCIYAASGTVTLQKVSCLKLLYYNLLHFRQLTFYRVTIQEAAYIQLRRRPPGDEQGNARNM